MRENTELHGGSRNDHLRRRYRITAEHAERMAAEQGGLCALCREAPATQVDHDHATGRVRGLLCFNCNGGLGQFRDRPELLMRAACYLTSGSRAAGALSPFSVGLVLGPAADPRPAGEPAPWQ